MPQPIYILKKWHTLRKTVIVLLCICLLFMSFVDRLEHVKKKKKNFNKKWKYWNQNSCKYLISWFSRKNFCQN